MQDICCSTRSGARSLGDLQGQMRGVVDKPLLRQTDNHILLVVRAHYREIIGISQRGLYNGYLRIYNTDNRDNA